MSAAEVSRSAWFRVEEAAPGVERIVEPFVDELLQGNIWRLRGRDRDLVVDAGLGVVSLREQLPHLFAHDPVLVVTHAHLDHIGGAHEFPDRRMHLLATDAPVAASLHGPELSALLGLPGDDSQDLLLDRIPAGFDPDRYRVAPVRATAVLRDGDTIELGDRSLTVLHLPGHTPDGVALLDAASGALFSGDVLYDDVLLDALHGSDRHDYARSLQRLLTLPVEIVYPGHGAPFGRRRMRELIEEHLRRWRTAAARSVRTP